MYTNPPSNVLSFMRKVGLLLVVLVHIRSLLDDCHIHVDEAIRSSVDGAAYGTYPLKHLNGKTLLLVNTANRMMKMLARRMAEEGGIVIQTCLPDEMSECTKRYEEYDGDGNTRRNFITEITNMIGGKQSSLSESIDSVSVKKYQIYTYALDIGNFTDIRRFSGLIMESFGKPDMIVVNANAVYRTMDSRELETVGKFELNIERHYLGPFLLIDEFLRNGDNDEVDGKEDTRVIYTGNDAFAYSSLHYHNGSTSSFHEIWHDQRNRCPFRYGYEYVLCHMLGGNQHAKAKLGNMFHVIALPSLYPHLHGYREDPFNVAYWKYLIRNVFMRDVKIATDLILYSLLSNYSQRSVFVDVMGHTHSMQQEYSSTPQPLGKVDASIKLDRCLDACYKQQEKMKRRNDGEKVKPLDCKEVCSRHVTSLNSSPVHLYRRLLYPSDITMRPIRVWMINVAIEVTGSSAIYIERAEKEQVPEETRRHNKLDTNIREDNYQSDEF